MVKCGRPPKGAEQQSRDRVLDAALQLFLEHGYGNLAMETIARDARVSLRTIYNEFGGKAGLFGALIKRCSDRIIDTLAGDIVPEVALVEFGTQFLFRVSRPEVVRMRAILIGESPRFPDLAIQFYEHGPRRTLDLLSRYFSTQQQLGRIRPGDPEFLASQFVSALRNERFQRLQLGLEPTPDEAQVEAWVRQSCELFLRGCATGSG
ncbi:TetR/AcrR family transcriptional regulator [Methylomonas sp. UP202]|uniref:TetR/AcrR family transcriptional regulator n=1 Tax=Methylomonas sp. UP202 TaxID=3040943 RepID=UPI00247A5337|nr:TetR/AcrR family transcriptional regulator [Methylomonas sp. UP202]WGS88082.1 TetR/AcrR family transcriptional regulator [Methylomonas sp. UP202]